MHILNYVQLLLSSSMDKTVRLWDIETKDCLKMFAHNDYGEMAYHMVTVFYPTVVIPYILIYEIYIS